MTPFELFKSPTRVVLLLLLVCFAPTALAAVDLAILPSTVTVQPNEIFDVELTITPAGSAFNGYDAVIGFDPDAADLHPAPAGRPGGAADDGRLLQPLPRLQRRAGGRPPGPQPRAALRRRQRHRPRRGLPSALPGRPGQRTTTISLDTGTAFYLAGLYVNPVFTHDAEIRIGGPSPVPGMPTAADPRLTAAPNPFNPSTIISFEAAAPTRARITIHNLRGERVADADAEIPPDATPWPGTVATTAAGS